MSFDCGLMYLAEQLFFLVSVFLLLGISAAADIFLHCCIRLEIIEEIASDCISLSACNGLMMFSSLTAASNRWTALCPKLQL